MAFFIGLAAQRRLSAQYLSRLRGVVGCANTLDQYRLLADFPRLLLLLFYTRRF